MLLSTHALIDFDRLRIHAEDAAFVLGQRALACEAPNYRLVDLYDLEQRLMGHLDALFLSREAGSEVALEVARADRDRDSAAVLLHVALRLGREDLIEQVGDLEPPEDVDCAFRRRLAEAVSWCSAEMLSTVMRRWIGGESAFFRWIALEVCGICRVDPRHYLERALSDLDISVRKRAARLAGELGRTDLLDAVLSVGDDDADLAAVLLGNASKAERLADPASYPQNTRIARSFAEVFPLALSFDDGKAAIRMLIAEPENRRWGVVAIGALGWSGALPSLLTLMEEPLCARVAVSAVEQITGIYFAHEELELETFPDDPENLQLEGSEAFSEFATPWPDPEKFRRWLDANMSNYSDKERLLLGMPAWAFNGPPEPWVKYQARHRWIATTQAMRRPEAPLPKWTSRVLLDGRSFGRDW